MLSQLSGTVFRNRMGGSLGEIGGAGSSRLTRHGNVLRPWIKTPASNRRSSFVPGKPSTWTQYSRS
jgi:hypothetical protein